MQNLRFGVFRLAQIWSVVQPDGTALGFPERRLAVCAAHSLAAASQRPGAHVEIVIQDELGGLTSVTPLSLAPRPASSSARVHEDALRRHDLLPPVGGSASSRHNLQRSLQRLSE
jgi:hypothetical protein